MERPPGFFQGSELPRLLVLAVVMVVGWALVWHFAKKLPQPAEPDLVATAKPEPIVADRSIEFETVTDRTPVGFRDDAAYALAPRRERATNRPPSWPAVSRRDVSLPHLWQNPELYRGVPIHLLGTARRVLRYPSKLSQTGWIYEASIITPDATRNPFVCVFEEAPPGLPIGPNLSERVVFNGYFLKIWKYQAGDVARGAPLLVGRIGWDPREPASTGGDNSTLRWSLIAIAGHVRDLPGTLGLSALPAVHRPAGLAAPLRADLPPRRSMPSTLEDWVHSMRSDGDSERR